MFIKEWAKLGKTISQLKAVLLISAHWLIRGIAITAMPFPKTIHDFGVFPKELFAVQYRNPGLASETVRLIKSTTVGLNHDWRLDAGT